MPGNTLSLEQRLNNGCATGALVLCVGGARFRVTVGEKGRGLVAARDVQKDETLCRLPGRLVDARTAPAGVEVFLVHKARRRGAPARWLVLDPATARAPGNLANTSDGSDAGNNACATSAVLQARLVVRQPRRCAAHQGWRGGADALRPKVHR
jgi:hypothetical protein